MLDPMPRQDVTIPPTRREAELMAEIERLRLLVETAYVEGALDFGGFNEATAARAERKFPHSDAALWRDDPDAAHEDTQRMER